MRNRDRAQVFEFGPFRFDTADRVLMRNGQSQHLYHKTGEVLLYLLENRGHVLTADEILNAVWPETHVVKNAIDRNISLLRRALGDDSKTSHYIQTFPKRGYRWVPT